MIIFCNFYFAYREKRHWTEMGVLSIILPVFINIKSENRKGKKGRK